MGHHSRRQFLIALGVVVVAGAMPRLSHAQRAGGHVHPVIAALRSRLSRAVTPSERTQFSSIDPSNTAQGNGHALALLACDNASRVLLPLALEASGRGEDATSLRAVSPITSDAGAAAMVDPLQRLSAVLLESNTCQGRAACASDPHVALGTMARDLAAACRGVSDGTVTDERVADLVAAAIESGAHLSTSRAALISGAASLLLGMTAIAH